MIKPRGLIVLAVAASFALAGCSSPAPDEKPSSTKDSSEVATTPEPESTTEPASGERLEGEGYSYSVPEGWVVQDNAQADTVAVDMTDTDGFADNVNVVVSKSGKGTLEQLEEAGMTQWQTSGGENVTLNDRIDVAGTESVHVSALLAIEAGKYQIDQYYIGSGNQTYVVTFSSSDSVSQADRDARAESILASWEWV